MAQFINSYSRSNAYKGNDGNAVGDCKGDQGGKRAETQH